MSSSWLAWLEHEVPYGPRTAQRAIALHRWAQENHALFERLAPLGPTKLYVLTTLPVAKLQRMADAARVTVPGTSVRIPIERLSFRQAIEFVRPTKGLTDAVERKRKIERFGRGIRRIAKATAALDVDDVPRATASRWHTTLLEAAAEFAERYGLE